MKADISRFNVARGFADVTIGYSVKGFTSSIYKVSYCLFILGNAPKIFIFYVLSYAIKKNFIIFYFLVNNWLHR